MKLADPKSLAAEIGKTMQCNCDLDRWQPENSTGHSWVCRIHKEAVRQAAALRAQETST